VNSLIRQFLVAGFCWITLAAATSAQTTGTEIKPRVSPGMTNAALNEQLRLARDLIRQRNHAGAAAYLEKLYAENNTSEIIFNLLRTCYMNLKQWTKAETISRRFTELYPDKAKYHFFLGDAFIKEGRREDALDAYLKSASLCNDQGAVRIATILERLLNENFIDHAVTIIDSIRIFNDDSSFFALQRGRALEAGGQYTAAAGEYFIALDTASSAAAAERQLHGMLDFPTSSEETEQALVALAPVSANFRAFRLLTNYYLGHGNYEKASGYAIRQDSAEGLKGAALIQFARNCQERKLFAEAVRMTEYLRSQHADQPLMADISLLQADALVQLGRVEEALALYDTVAAATAYPGAIGEALYAIGTIYYSQLRDYDKALIYFDSVVNHHRRGKIYLDARLRIPRVYLAKGDLEEADAHLKVLSERHLTEDAQEEVMFYRGLIRFFNKQFDSSRADFQKMIVKHPRGYYVNDALELLVLIDEAAGSPELLHEYSNALLFEERQMPDSAIVHLQAVADASNRAIADFALYRLASTTMNHTDTSAVLGCLYRLIEEFPESYYLPYSLKMKADIFFVDEATSEDARQIYRRLLEEFPTYPFIPDVREKMRREDGGQS